MENELLLKELERLRKENTYLKQLLSDMMHQRDEKAEDFEDPQKVISNRSLPQDKINLFKSLFKGRTDVFAYRWESKEGRRGYTPACDLEWHKPICQKPKIKCSECTHRKLSTLSDQVLYNHLSGVKTVGLYPLLLDETCFFLAVDFDKQNWKEDVLAFVKECKSTKVPAYVERSSSGNGAHVWIFFSEKIPAALARKLGTYLLTKAIEKRYLIGMDSFDRMFPNQDTLPRGGFGNLIALPLQLHSKNKGNSVFIDENFIPYPDQWLFLSSVEKISKQDIFSVIDNRNYTQIKEILLPIPTKIQVILKNGIYIKKQGIPSLIFSKMMSLSTFKNPEIYKAQAKRLSTYGLQRTISCFDEDSEYLILPRGCFEDLQKLLKEYSIEMDVIDESFEGDNIEVNFNGQLTSQQEEALNELLQHDNGTLVAATGFGKTVTAAALISQRKTNTLIIVNRTQLLQQWIESLATFLQLKILDKLVAAKIKSPAI